MLSRLFGCRALQDRASLAEVGHGSDRLQGPDPWMLVGVEIPVLQKIPGEAILKSAQQTSGVAVWLCHLAERSGLGEQGQ